MILATASNKARCLKALERLDGAALDYEVAAEAGLTVEEVREAMKELKEGDWGIDIE